MEEIISFSESCDLSIEENLSPISYVLFNSLLGNTYEKSPFTKFEIILEANFNLLLSLLENL